MRRLNQRAFEILRAEIQRCCQTDVASQFVQEVALKRLERLRSQSGTPLTLEEMRKEIAELFPNFSEKALKTAARANRQNPTWGKVKLATLLLLGTAGVIGVANLPIPMVRWSVARTAPWLLFPSYISMDYNYRRAIARVEQADQLVNQSTNFADLDLGNTKVKEAQSHLDALPVWFLGYYPQRYCSFFQCGWQFTLDEFQSARKNVARMEAKLFQEKNAQAALEQGEQALGQAQEQYRQSQAEPDKNNAIADWQAAIDVLQQIPSETLAGRIAKTKLPAYERDFQQVAGVTAGTARTGTLIAAAQQFATLAETNPNSARSVAEWQEVIGLWDDAIARLQQITDTDPDYLQAQKLLATYRKQQGNARVRLQAEKSSADAFEAAQALTNNLVATTSSNPAFNDRGRVASQLMQIINQLKKVQKGTTVYSEAQQLLTFAQNKLKQLK
jgi:hypothetical protein